MQTITVTKTVETPVALLRAEMGVRYWEDAEVNGVGDTDGDLIPGREGDTWRILIDLDEGRILGWPEGTTAKTHYKVCDAGVYTLLAPNSDIVLERSGYVPSILYPNADGFGDYVILNIDGSGLIEGWRADLSCFEDED